MGRAAQLGSIMHATSQEHTSSRCVTTYFTGYSEAIINTYLEEGHRYSKKLTQAYST